MKLEELKNHEKELHFFQLRVGFAGFAVLVAFALLFARFFGWTPREYFEAREPVGDRVPVSLA